MPIKIALDPGHGLNTAGKRCMKSLDQKETREWYLNQRIATKVQEKLKAYDVEVLRVDDVSGDKDIALATRCKKANDWGATIYCSMHHNAGVNGGAGGGLSIITYDDGKESIAIRDGLYQAMLKAGALKGNRSNPKYANNGLYVLRSTKMPAVLVEHGFMDSKTDVPVILTEAYAEACANGWIAWLESYLGLQKRSQVAGSATKSSQKAGYLVVITASVLNVRAGAGTGYKISTTVKKNEVYTIVEEKMNGSTKWGRLKSGAGWISLGYTKKK